VPDPAVVEDPRSARADEEAAVEVVEIVRRSFLALATDRRAALREEATGRSVGDVEPVPRGAVNHENAPSVPNERERERHRLHVVVAAVERQRRAPGMQVVDAAVSAVVVHDRRDCSTRRDVQPRRHRVVEPQLPIALRRRQPDGAEVGGHAGVGVEAMHAAPPVDDEPGRGLAERREIEDVPGGPREVRLDDVAHSPVESSATSTA
jgi:hypothetical protein